MASLEKLNVQLGAATSRLNRDLKQASKSITSFSEGVESKLNSISTDRLNQGLANIDASAVPAADRLASSFKGLQRPTANTTSAVINFNRVIQDAPFGILGVSNNIEPLISSFNQLRASTGSTTGALKTLLTSAFTGPGALITIVSVASSAMIFFGNKLGRARKKADDLSDAMKPLNKSWERVIELQGQFDAFADDPFDIEKTSAQIREITEDIVGQKSILKRVNRLERERSQIIAGAPFINDEMGERLDFINDELNRLGSTKQVREEIKKLEQERLNLSAQLVNTADALADSDTRAARQAQMTAEQKKRQKEFEEAIAEARKEARVFEAPKDDILGLEDIDVSGVDLNLPDKIFPPGSIGALQNRLSILQEQMKSAVPGSEDFISARQGIQSVESALNKLKDNMESTGELGVFVGKRIGEAFAQAIVFSDRLGDSIKNLAKQLASRAIINFLSLAFSGGLGSLFGGGISGFLGGLLGFQSGGVVPGPLGAPRLAVVHGGETVLTPEQSRLPQIIENVLMLDGEVVWRNQRKVTTGKRR